MSNGKTNNQLLELERMPQPVFRKTLDIGDFTSPITGSNEKEMQIILPSIGFYKGEILNALFVGYAGDPMQLYKDLTDKIQIKVYVGSSRLGFVSSCNLRTCNVDTSTGYLRGPVVSVNNKDTSLPVQFSIENDPTITVQFNIDYSTSDLTKVLYEITFRGIYRSVRR